MSTAASPDKTSSQQSLLLRFLILLFLGAAMLVYYRRLFEPAIVVRLLALVPLVFLGSYIFIFRPIRYSGSIRALGYVLLALLTWSAVSLAWTTNLSEGVFEWTRMATIFAVLWILIHSLSSKILKQNHLIYLVAIVGFVHIVVALLQHAELILIDPADHAFLRPFGLMTGKNLLCSFLGILAPTYLYLLKEKSKLIRLASLIAFVLCLFLIFIGGSRGVFLGIATTLFLLTCLTYTKIGLSTRFRKKTLIGLISFVAILVALIFGSRFLGLGTLGSFYRIKYKVANNPVTQEKIKKIPRSQHERMHMWKSSLQMVRAYPFTGVGLGNYKVMIQRFHAPLEAGKIVRRPHNLMVLFLCELGIPGAMLLLLLILVILNRIWLSIKTAAKDSTKEKRALLTGGLVIFAVSSMVSFPWERIASMMLVCSYLAILFGGPTKSTPFKKAQKKVYRSFSGVVLAFIGTLLVYVVYLNFQFNTFLPRAIYNFNKGNFALAQKQALIADHFWQGLDKNSQCALFYAANSAMGLGKSKEGMELFERGKQLGPYQLGLLLNQGISYSHINDLDKAIEIFELVLELNPNVAQANLYLGNAYFRNGNREKALLNLSKCEEIHDGPTRKVFESLKKE